MPFTLDRALIIDQKDTFMEHGSRITYQDQGHLHKVASLRSPHYRWWAQESCLLESHFELVLISHTF